VIDDILDKWVVHCVLKYRLDQDFTDEIRAVIRAVVASRSVIL
jgi:hypothetical protein